MKKFGCSNYQDYIPVPVYESNPEYVEFYKKACYNFKTLSE